MRIEDILKPKYRSRNCQRAAQGTVAGIASDAVDEFLPTSGLTTWIDWFTGFYILRCAGWSTGTIVLYCLVLCVAVLTLFVVLEPIVKSMMPKKCKICTEHSIRTVSGKRKSVCVHERDGTPEECKGSSGIVAFIAAVLLVALVNFIYMFSIKMKIFTPQALTGSVLARFFL